MSEAKEELKPCPFCGKPPKHMDRFLNGDGVREYEGYVVFCCSAEILCDEKEEAFSGWNNAYCWKELDKARLQALESEEVQELFKAFNMHVCLIPRDLCPDCKKIDAFNALLRRLRGK